MSKVTVNKLRKRSNKIAWVTSYSYPLAYMAEKAGIDMILVGDSGGMCELGYKTTNPVTMNEMLGFCKAVLRGAPNTFIIGDMPQGSYEISDSVAIKNAIKFAKIGCDAVKLEGGSRILARVEAIRSAGIEVICHMGLTPQTAASFGGYRVQAKSEQEISTIIQEVGRIHEKANILALLLEATPPLSAQKIANELDPLPIYGIGAGPHVDGQLLTIHDILGLYPDFKPKFAKCYVSEVLVDFMASGGDGFLKLGEMAIKRFVDEVKGNKFPSREFCYGGLE